MVLQIGLLLSHFWKDLFIDCWYNPATAEAARRYYSAPQQILAEYHNMIMQG